MIQRIVQFALYVGVSVGLFVVLFMQIGQAQLDVGLKPAQNIGLGTTDLRDTIASIISVTLGILGMIALVIVLYGGFQYMTAGGDTSKVENARKLMMNAGIGLGIVVTSYAITALVFNVLLTGTGVGGPGVPGSSGNGGGGGSGGGSSYTNDLLAGCGDPDPFDLSPYICSISKQSDVPGAVLTINGGKFTDNGGSVFFVTRDLVESARDFPLAEAKVNAVFADCATTDGCFEAEILQCGADSTWSNNQIVVVVPQGIAADAVDEWYVIVQTTAVDGTTVNSADKDTREQDSFDQYLGKRNDIFTELTGEVGPGLICLLPSQGRSGNTLTMIGRGFGDVADIVIFKNDKDQLNDDYYMTSFDSWSDESITFTVPEGLITGPVAVRVDAQESNELRFDVTCDVDADCPYCCMAGVAVNYCAKESLCILDAGGQVGDACTMDADCQEGNICDPLDQICIPADEPYISGFDPRDGGPGTFVTIVGYNFGDEPGVVEFFDANGVTYGASDPTACENVDLWTNREVVIATPADLPAASDLLIRLTRADNGSDDTSDLNNKFFRRSTTVRPGLCRITDAGGNNKTAGFFNEVVNFKGQNFKSADDTITQRTVVQFSGAVLGNESQWEVTQTSVSNATIPNIRPGTRVSGQVVIQTIGDDGEVVDEVFSNPITGFFIQESPRIPIIDSIDITRGPKGQYVSIFGKNFGARRGNGTVLIKDANGNELLSNFDALDNFPQVCGDIETWKDNNIVIKIPEELDVLPSPGKENELQLRIAVRNNDNLTNTSDNDALFTLCNTADAGCTLTPGICKIEVNGLSQAPAGTSGVKIYGEGFGATPPNEVAVKFFNEVDAVKTFINTFKGNLSLFWSPSIIGPQKRVKDGDFVVVPQGAQSGPVYLEINGIRSNAVHFDVIDCRDDENICGETLPVCCQMTGQCMTAEMAQTACRVQRPPISQLVYDFTTGQAKPRSGVPRVVHQRECGMGTQSPSPYRDAIDTCVNAQVSVRFEDRTGAPIPMAWENFNTQEKANALVRVERCAQNADEFFNDVFCEASEVIPANADTQPIYGDNNAVIGFTYLIPHLELNTWYRVTLISGPSGFRSVDGFWLDGDRDGIPEQDDNYTWVFKTGNDPQACQVDEIEILPDDAELNAIGDEQSYSASIIAKNCNILDSTSFDWEWSTRLQNGAVGDAIATVSQDTLETGYVAPTQRATAQGQGLAYVEGRAFTVADNGTRAEILYRDRNNRLVVDFNIPEIIDFLPKDGLVNPSVNAYTTIIGRNFGELQEGSVVQFDGIEAQIAQCRGSWSDTRIVTKVPKPQDIPVENEQLVIGPAGAHNVFQALLSSANAFAAYTFNDDSNTIAADEVGEHDALLVNINKIASELEGRAVTITNNEISKSYIQAIYENSNINALTLSAWIRPREAQNAVIAKIHSITTPLQSIILSVADNGSVSVSVPSVDGVITLTSNAGVLLPNTWQQIVITINSERVQLVVNGVVLAESDDKVNSSMLGESFALTIGGDSNILLREDSTADREVQSVGSFNGDIDDVGVFQSILSREQMAALAGIDMRQRGQIALFRFEEDGVQITDASRNKLTTRSNNFPQRVQVGYFGKSLAFDGKSHYLQTELPSNALLSGELTIAAWVKPHDLDRLQTIIDMSASGGPSLTIGDNCSSNNNKDICLRTADGQPFASVDAAAFNLVENTELTNNAWAFIVGVMHADRLELYVNGQLARLFETSYEPTLTQPRGSICIGAAQQADGSCAGEFFAGELDTIAVYNMALSAQVIARLNGALDTSELTVRTNGGTATAPDTFNTISPNIYPFICGLEPSYAPGGAILNFIGDNFGDAVSAIVSGKLLSNGSFLKYIREGMTFFIPGSSPLQSWTNKLITIANPISQTTDSYIRFNVRISPQAAPFLDQNGNGAVDEGEGEVPSYPYVETPYLESNTVYLQTAPVITDLSPDNGPANQWVTIKGYNFGDVPGEVFFTSATGIVEAPLVKQCGDAAWSNTQVIVSVPPEALTGAVYLVKKNGIESNKDRSFVVNNNPLGPGLCPIDAKLQPQYPLAPGNVVTLTGTRFLPVSGLTKDVGTDIRVNLNTQTLTVTNLDGYTDEMMEAETRIDSSSGDVQVFKRVQIGETCPGFHIGNFCPGGRKPEFGFVPSNVVTLNIAQDRVCQIGVHRSERYLGAFETTPDTLLPVRALASNGTYLFSLDAAFGIIRRIGTGYNGTTRGAVTATYTPQASWVAPSIPPSLVYLSNGDLYYSAGERELRRIILENQSWRSEVAYTGAESVDGLARYTANGRYLFNVYKNKDNKWQVDVIDPFPNAKGDLFTSIATFTIDIPTNFVPAQVFADANFIYFLEAGELQRMFYVEIRDKHAVNWYKTDQSLYYELGGTIDPFNNIAWIGEADDTRSENDGAPFETVSKNLIHRYQCTSSDVYSCTTNADCDQKCSIAGSQCIAGTCTPIIEALKPEETSVGGYLSIKGCFLGNTGTVYFADGTGATTIPGITPNEALCGITKTDTQWVIEVPDEIIDSNDDGNFRNDPDDAHSGPVRLERDLNGEKISTETINISREDATQVQRDSLEPIYSFGVPDLIVDNSKQMPFVCSIIPSKGDPKSFVSIHGKGFGDTRGENDVVMFYGSSADGDNRSMTEFCSCGNKSCGNKNNSNNSNEEGSSSSEWSDSKICGIVPVDAVTGEVEVTNDRVESDNDVVFGVYELQYGPRLISSNPGRNEDTSCTNALVVLNFDSQIDKTTIDNNITLLSCRETITSKLRSTIVNAWRAIKSAIMHETYAETPSRICTTVVPITTTTRINGNITEITLTPENILTPDTYYRVKLEEYDPNNGRGIKDVRGIPLNHVRSESGALQLLEGDDYLTEFDFHTRGNKTPDAYDPGICQFDDVEIAVYNNSSGTGQLADKDFFVCAGDNCRLPFDYDQAPGPLTQDPQQNFEGNQHRYIALGLSEITDQVRFDDQFERERLNQGDNSFVSIGNCEFTHDQGVGRIQSSNDCDQGSLLIATNETDGTVRIFPQSTPYTLDVEIRGGVVGTGVVVGGNLVFTKAMDDGIAYVIQKPEGKQQQVSRTVTTLPNVSLWEIEWLNGIIRLTVDGRQILPEPTDPVRYIYGNTGEFGLYIINAKGDVLAEWDNFFLNVRSFNVLSGTYTWSRSDRIDPLRLLNLDAPNVYNEKNEVVRDDVTADIIESVQNKSGEVYVSVTPIATGQTKLFVQATTNAGLLSNTVSRELPINIFICENPWPDIDEQIKTFIKNGQFVDARLNFMTRYCRDVGDPSDPTDNLPAATIIQN